MLTLHAKLESCTRRFPDVLCLVVTCDRTKHKVGRHEEHVGVQTAHRLSHRLPLPQWLTSETPQRQIRGTEDAGTLSATECKKAQLCDFLIELHRDEVDVVLELARPHRV